VQVTTVPVCSQTHAIAVMKPKEITMNEDRMKGNWKQFKGKVQEQWGKLTDDDLDVIDGKREQLLGKIQERHGITKDEAEKQVSDFHGRNPTNFFERS
jgi:uncharacterized protein YjbJ (UPF0337 family)